jgi:hypothetical protein
MMVCNDDAGGNLQPAIRWKNTALIIVVDRVLTEA